MQHKHTMRSTFFLCNLPSANRIFSWMSKMVLILLSHTSSISKKKEKNIFKENHFEDLFQEGRCTAGRCRTAVKSTTPSRTGGWRWSPSPAPAPTTPHASTAAICMCQEASAIWSTSVPTCFGKLRKNQKNNMNVSNVLNRAVNKLCFLVQGIIWSLFSLMNQKLLRLNHQF